MNNLRFVFSRQHLRHKLSEVTMESVVLYTFTFVLVIFALLPLVYLINSAFKPLDEILRFPPRFFVRKPTMDNFSNLVVSLGSSTVPFLRYVFNSLVTTVATVGGTVLVCVLGAYGLVSGLLYRRLPRKASGLYIALVAAMLIGRGVWGIVMVFLSGASGAPFTWAAFLAGAITNAIPGIIIQLLLLPALILALQRAEKTCT